MTALALSAALLSSPELGKPEGRCRTGETGPAIVVDALGLKDRQGVLRLELYPDDDQDFLADDNILLSAGKTFARTDIEVPATGPASLCIRVPRPGRYALSLLHDRDGNLKFDLSADGIGFPGDPRLGWSRPKASQASVIAGPGLTHIAIRLNYRRGLAMRPLEVR